MKNVIYENYLKKNNINPKDIIRKYGYSGVLNTENQLLLLNNKDNANIKSDLTINKSNDNNANQEKINKDNKSEEEVIKINNNPNNLVNSNSQKKKICA